MELVLVVLSAPTAPGGARKKDEQNLTTRSDASLPINRAPDEQSLGQFC